MRTMTPLQSVENANSASGWLRARRVILLPLITLVLMSSLLALAIRQQRGERLIYSRNVTSLMAGQVGRLLTNAFTRQTRLLSRLRAEERLVSSDEQLPAEQLAKDVGGYNGISGLIQFDGAGVAKVAWSGLPQLSVGEVYKDAQNAKWQHALAAARANGSPHVVSADEHRLEMLLIVLSSSRDADDLRAFAVGLRLTDFVAAQVGPHLLSQFAITLQDKSQRTRFTSGTAGDVRIHETIPIECIDAPWKLNIAPTTEFFASVPSRGSDPLLYTAIVLTLFIPLAVLRVNLRTQTEQQEARRRLAAVEGLNRVAGELLADQADANTMLALLGETASEVFDMPSVSVLIPRDNGQEVDLVYWKGDSSPPPQRVYLLSELTGTQHCLTTQQFLFTEDVTVNPAGFQEQILKRHGVRSSILLPLIAKQRSIGVLNLCDKRPRRFTEFDRGLMRLFSNQAAIILGQSRLLEQLRDHLETNRVLLHELNHRVKNNLNGIQGLLVMDQPDLSSDAQAWLDRVSQRIETMARAHELFSGHRPHMRLDEFLRTTIDSVAAIKPGAVRLQLDLGNAEAVQLTGDHAVTLAMAINELCYNALVHGAGNDGEVHVQVRSDESLGLQISITDVPGVDRADRGGVATMARSSTGVGLSLVSGLITRELSGKLEFLHGPSGGTCAHITIPLEGAKS